MKTNNYPSKSKVRRAEGTLAASSGGRRAWDPDTLHVAAMQCLLGDKAVDFEGRPHDSKEYGSFARAWALIQAANIEQIEARA